jgi:hypothetical protein
MKLSTRYFGEKMNQIEISSQRAYNSTYMREPGKK